MDEPTNDLDIETLELLEELLSQFSGTLLLVSHDRSFMDNIVTRTLAFEGNGKVSEYVGGYQDWLAQAPKIVAAKHKDNTSIKTNSVKQFALDSKEKKELAGLLLEKQQQKLFTEMTEPGFYEQTNDKVSQATEKLKKVEREIEQAYARWDELEGRRLLFDV